MKKFLSFGLLSLCSFSIYASQCNIDFEKKNYEKVLEKCTQKAEQGDANAQTVLGFMYYEGDGVEQNKSLAKNYLNQSCDLGFEKACNKLKND
ncbi:hypothetical protein B6D12_01425 [Gilliamella apicola]|uniref:tetratricopeptide repeat protein n=2 Tax=Gilliamella apicola TaxID=1196095 RepID=UPI000A353DDB|nr:sel1 repeat family protein [Gilliamella apicola]OTP91063.1 hypothetical protein B5S41_02025 [Gilliamella apicola]OTP96445.1 hypothetical protein B6D13_00545 [Gilliamella apicola]OTP97436.1 hypothetical protein B6D05_00560 [Gilliamella apicola]OTQ03592.1 hypothetical protein B6D07_00590 [Gilliamella apicola]OTQ06999.1 hypothetical protein B6D12_01425 [Gilliamella apicola]